MDKVDKLIQKILNATLDFVRNARIEMIEGEYGNGEIIFVAEAIVKADKDWEYIRHLYALMQNEPYDKEDERYLDDETAFRLISAGLARR